MIASCVRKDQIPAEYRDFPLLGRGTTSLALLRPDGTVLMLTRDRMKLDWLRDAAAIGAQWIGSLDTTGHHIPGMDELPLYTLTMPRLRPLSPGNRRLVDQAIKEFDQVRMAADRAPLGRGGDDVMMRGILDHYLEREDHLLYPLFDFLKDYDPSQFRFDLGRRNFMEDSAGRVAVLDPIWSTELETLITEYKRNRHAAAESGARAFR